MSADLLFARSLSSALSSSSRPLRVLSVHRRVLNLADGDEDIVAVVWPEVGNGPFHIVLAQPVAFDFARPGIAAQWQADVLTAGGLRISLARARRWNPRLESIRLPARSLAALQSCAQASDLFRQRREGMDRNTLARLQMGGALMARGVQQEDDTALRKGVSLLAGLGPGLTPAGDDYLLGVLARLQLDAALPGIDLLTPSLNTAVRFTTRLSRVWLRHAMQGQFDARWHALAAVLPGKEEKAICRAAEGILRVGASSGPQALAGFLLV